MLRLLLPVLVAGSAVAQKVTGLPQINNANIVAAVNTNDPEYEICTLADQYLNMCISSLGGSEALSTAAPTDIVACACCIDGTAIAPAFSTCSNYIKSEEPTLTSEYSAYGDLYAMCTASAACRASATGGSGSGGATGSAEPTVTTSLGAASSAITMPASITQSASLGPVPSECSSMINMFSSCVAETKGFADLPYGEQASCYCCETTRNQVVWTDILDGYASTCRDWASTGEPDTIYPIASTFARFCDNFSDACQGATPTGSDSSSPTGDSGANDDGSVTTVTVAPEPTGDNAASSLQAGAFAGLAAVVGAVLML